MSYTKLIYSEELKAEYFRKSIKDFCSKYKVSTHTAYKIFWPKPKCVIKKTIKNLNDYLQMSQEDFAAKHSISTETLIEIFWSKDDAKRLLKKKKKKKDPYVDSHVPQPERREHEYYKKEFEWCTIVWMYWAERKYK